MSAALDPRLPVLVGVGQVSQRVDRGEPSLEPARLMAEALSRAALDAGTARLLARTDSIRVIAEISWPYPDPAQLVGDLLRVRPRETTSTTISGNLVQSVVNQTAADIQEGRVDVVLIAGGESWHSIRTARRDGIESDWTRQPDNLAPSRIFGDDAPMSAPEESAIRLRKPVQIYPLFEIALRAAAGRTPSEHVDHIAQLWARFSEVAATNPYAWDQHPYSAQDLSTVTPDNRMIGYPYTKRMNSNIAVDQGAGLIMCSVGTARHLGVPSDRWVFVHAGADAHDKLYVSNRADLHSSPAIRVAGRGALDLAGVSADDVDHVDLYSCFPSAVQIAASELGFDIERPLTVTGGMSFAGGPFNNYTMHGIATMAEVLRDDPGGMGLCTGNGGYVTKHSFGVYSTDPPLAGRFRHTRPQAEVDQDPGREVVTGETLTGHIESYAVMYDRAGQTERAFVPIRTIDGRRAWGTTTESGLLGELVASEHVGSAAVVDEGGSLHLT